MTSYRRLSGQAKIAASFEGEADDAFLDHLAGLSLGGSEKQESWLGKHALLGAPEHVTEQRMS